MARKKKGKNPKVEDYRHEDAKGKNILPDWLPVATLLRWPNRGFF